MTGSVTAATAFDVPRSDPSGLALLRDDLKAFTVDAVVDLLGPVAHAALGREQPVPARTAVTEGPSAAELVATLIAAFVLGLPVSRARLDAALPRLGSDGAVRLGLVASSGQAPDDDVRALVDLRPYAATYALGSSDWWVVSDVSELATRAPLRTDHALGVGGASVTLARCTIRRPVAGVLDLGTGCGVQALHATRHARHVTGTDVSWRRAWTPPSGWPTRPTTVSWPARLRVAGDVTEERYHRPGAVDPEVVLLRQGGGFGRVVRADTALAAFVGACDGELTAGQIAGALAQLVERPVTEIVTGLLPTVRALIGDGFLGVCLTLRASCSTTCAARARRRR